MNLNLIRNTLLLAVLLPVAILQACSTTQSTNAPKNSNATEPWSIDHDSWYELGYRWEWTGFPLMQAGAGLTDAVAYKDAIITTASDTTVTCLESSTGKVRWAKQLDRPTTQLFEPTRVDQTLFICSDTELHEINIKNGNTLDRDSVHAIINTKPIIMDNLALFGTTRNEFFAFELRNDFKLWSYKFDGEIQSPAVNIDGQSVAMISAGGDLRVLNARDGSSIMKTNIAGGSLATILANNQTVYIPSTDQSIYAFNIEDGLRKWRKRTSEPVLVQPVIHKGVMYASTADDGLVALDAITGQPLWTNTTIQGWVVSLANNDELMVWTGTALVAVDKDSGEIIASATLNGAAGIRADNFIDGNLYVITQDGAIAKFSLR
ncbi:MAG: PQQ-binding-like beta-propeller repeat protein [Phycisphaerales bacterium]|nr:PQQ-binding-like beta-propeller repeat protein [Phycisphaerales bacterium]